MLELFVLDAASGKKVPTFIRSAKRTDLATTQDWQTNWMSFLLWDCQTRLPYIGVKPTSC